MKIKKVKKFENKVRDNSFSTYTKYSKKHFSEIFAYVLNEWSLIHGSEKRLERTKMYLQFLDILKCALYKSDWSQLES